MKRKDEKISDAQRLDWLSKKCEAVQFYGDEATVESYPEYVSYTRRNLRLAIDAAIRSENASRRRAK